MDAGHAAGSFTGMAIATYKGVLLMISPLGFISWGLIGETAILAGVGGAAGWIIAELLKLVKVKIQNLRSKHD